MNLALDVQPGLEAMDALSVPMIPVGPGWQYEPKWDGFRCLAFRDGSEVQLQSKSGQPLGRYFPELVDDLGSLQLKKFVFDGEIVLPQAEGLSFDALLMRIHPAPSRIAKLAATTPALLIVFDLLCDSRGKSLVELPLAARRERLEAVAAKIFPPGGRVRLSPSTTSLDTARKWLGSAGTSLDGLMAKRMEEPYRAGERGAMQKIKPRLTADCVVGGFRYATKGGQVGSLLLGLFDQDGLLHHVGFCAGLKAAERPALTRRLQKLVKAPGFTGRAPGGPSRWSTERSAAWQPLRPALVVEVEFDHVTNQRFRHGTKFMRWRPDKKPAQCRMDQLKQKSASGMLLGQLLG